ncbi:hypothetical protein WA026_021395 [Henosepilachna vigintioctopunctata]|uniref:IkappaB kinase n=1 Tax=Henosepilachna vigintioctopunctata TaxID=420089 RepID=A0AAW1TNQ7_9CUCU
MEEPREIGKWKKISVLGSGGFGTVVLWRCSTTDESVAVKKCRIQCQNSLTSKQKERWRNEVKILKELDHPNVIKYKPLPLDFENELNKYNPTGLPLLSMEYCQKGNLRHILTQPTNLRGLSEETVKDVLRDISGAVSYLHSQNITHRDIKPDNIVLHDCPSARDGVIYKLIDLGYAKELGDATVSFVGTLYYLAPEIFANRRYDASVDYWSLGVLAFEIICGVLPFSAVTSPVERFNWIKKKGPNDICVYISNHGNLEYSSELFKENHISSCLKEHIEVWLRRVLHFNPRMRSCPVPNSPGVFDHLACILKKKILRVFSVYKYEFYSYEFDSFTRLSSVKLWIARDTNITEKDQLLLGNVQFNTCDDQTLLIDCLAEEKYEIFVFRKTSLFNKDRHHLPRRVKIMFEKATELFNWRELKAIYSDAIYYISQDILHATSFSEAMDLHLKHLRYQVTRIQQNGSTSRQRLLNLLLKLRPLNQAIKGQNLGSKDIELARRLLELYSSIEKCQNNEYHLAVNIKKWTIKVDAIREMYSQLDIVKLPKLQEALKEAIHLLHTTANNADNNNNLSVIDMSKIVCHVMKLKDKLLTDKNLQVFVNYLGKATNHLESLLSWMRSFDSHIESLSVFFNRVESDAYSTLRNTSESNANMVSLGTDPKVENAVKRSEILNARIEQQLNEGLGRFQKFCDDVRSCLSDMTATASM